MLIKSILSTVVAANRKILTQAPKRSEVAMPTNKSRGIKGDWADGLHNNLVEFTFPQAKTRIP